MENRPLGDSSGSWRVLLVGPGELPDATQRALHAAAAQVTRLVQPSDTDIREALTEQVDSVIICSRDDAVALRLALVVEHVRPGVPLIVTVHGRIVSSQLERAVSNIRVTSMAEIVAPTLAGPSLDDRLLWVRRTPEGFSGERADHAKLQLVTIEASGRHRWQQLLAGLGSLLAVAFTALFTAGVVERLLDRRLTTLFGSRRVPRKGHVVVVGLGQVGLRLCLLLRELGVPTVAVESDPDRYNVARAKNYGLPVVIGRGGSHFLLRRLSLHRARALAAVTSHEIENISVAVAALGMQDSLRTILRAGRGEVVNETRSLFRIGVVRDVYRIGGTLLAAAALGSNAMGAFLREQTVYLIMLDGRIEPFRADAQTASAASAALEARN